MSIQGDLQALSQDTTIQLFTLNNYNPLSPYDSFLFTNHIGVRFGAKVYTPLACGIDKLKITSQGTQPEIGLTVSDQNAVITKLIQEFQFIEGANLTTIITKKRYLDGEPMGDAPVEDRTIARIDMRVARRQSHKPGEGIIFVLSNAIDFDGVELPRRLALRKCTWQYRSAQCGYAGSRFFTKAGVPTLDREEDSCGRELLDCRKRFNEERYGGFPSLNRR